MLNERFQLLLHLQKQKILYKNNHLDLKLNHLLGKDVVLEVPQRELSRAIGQHRKNTERLLAETGTRVLRVRGRAESDQIYAYSP